jgi:hypothetical protein
MAYHSFLQYSRRESENFLKDCLILSATYEAAMPTKAWLPLDFYNASLLQGTTPIWRKCRKLYFQPSCYAQPGLTFKEYTFCPHIVFMYCVWIWEQTAIISLFSINWPAFRCVRSIAKSDKYLCRVSQCSNSASTGRIFTKFDIWVFFGNLSRKFMFH